MGDRQAGAEAAPPVKRRPTPVVTMQVSEAGELRWTPQDKRAITMLVATFAGKRVDLSIVEHKPQRSLSQNARYWALLTVGAASLWGDPSEAERLHEELAHLLLALPPCPKTGLRRRRRTPNLNTKEFAAYTDLCVDKLIQLGADLSEWDATAKRNEAA